MTILDVAAFAGLSWDTVKSIWKRRLEKDYGRIRLKGVKRIGVDEIYLGKKLKFVTLVMDLDSQRIIWVGKGKGALAMKEFWRRMKCARASVEVVAMDMSGAYAQSVREHAPHAIITFDRFHVIKLMNERLDDLRRQLVREAETEDQARVIKGTRWLLLRRAGTLDLDGQEHLQEALQLNAPLAAAYMMKEDLAQIWAAPDRATARWNIQAWCVRAKATGIRQLLAMAKTLKRHLEGILSYFKTGVTSAMVEGTNRKIRTLFSQVYGLRDSDYLVLRLYALHESKLSLVG
jgi:transposase